MRTSLSESVLLDASVLVRAASERSASTKSHPDTGPGVLDVVLDATMQAASDGGEAASTQDSPSS